MVKSRRHTDSQTYQLSRFIHHGPICHCELKAPRCGPSLLPLLGGHLCTILIPLFCSGHLIHLRVSLKKKLTWIVHHGVQFQKKNGAQCAPWCTNAPIFLCDGAQMPLRQTDIDGCKITPMSPPCKFYRQLAKKRKEAFAAITLDIVLNSEHAYLPYQTMYSMRRISWKKGNKSYTARV